MTRRRGALTPADDHLARPGRTGRPGGLPRPGGRPRRPGGRTAAGARAVAGVWAGPPFGVLALRPVALLDAADIDTTVSAQRLLEALNGLAGTGETAVADSRDPCSGRPGPRCCHRRPAGPLEAEVPVAVVVDQVAVAVEGFRRRVDALPADGRTRPRSRRSPTSCGRQPSVGPVPMRAAHAASQLGFLGRDGDGHGLPGWRLGPARLPRRQRPGPPRRAGHHRRTRLLRRPRRLHPPVRQGPVSRRDRPSWAPCRCPLRSA